MVGYGLHLANNIVALCLFLLLALRGLILILLQPRITLSNNTLNSAELASLLCDTHNEVFVSIYLFKGVVRSRCRRRRNWGRYGVDVRPYIF